MNNTCTFTITTQLCVVVQRDMLIDDSFDAIERAKVALRNEGYFWHGPSKSWRHANGAIATMLVHDHDTDKSYSIGL